LWCLQDVYNDIVKLPDRPAELPKLDLFFSIVLTGLKGTIEGLLLFTEYEGLRD
jgi:hypothetical protein